jgi:uncharacterized protein with ParB-like and HNH nuclease domain
LVAELYNQKYLDLDPEYQRDVVWDEKRASALIQSLFRKLLESIVILMLILGLEGFFIPPVIFNVVRQYTVDDDGNSVRRNFRVCVDGKQRLSSIVKFMNGEVPVTDSGTPSKKWQVILHLPFIPLRIAHRILILIQVLPSPIGQWH